VYAEICEALGTRRVAWQLRHCYQFQSLLCSPAKLLMIVSSTGIVRDVEGVRHLAELGVVFLLFNIGLELSLERLRSMQKFVFGLGGLQVYCTWPGYWD
jgi:Kef-type K+ transport system membrane component KefB